MYETIEKDLRRISDWLEAIGTANVDYRKVVINAALDLNWYKTIKDAADALESADKRIAELAKQAEHTDQVDAMIFATHLKQTARIAELVTKCRQLEAQLPKEGECEAKKPKTVKETGYSFYCDCPTCGGRLISNVDGEWCAGSFDRFCKICGQKIDWSEYCGRSNMPRGARMKENGND